MSKGKRTLLIVILTTALVLTPLILGGALLGFYVGPQIGYSGTILAIAFSTIGFVIGMVVIWTVIKAVVGRTPQPTG